MAITNFTELCAAVARRIHRTDLTSDLPVCIQLAESRIKAGLIDRWQDASATLPVTAGDDTVTLPTDFQSMRTLSVLNSAPPLEYLTPELLSARWEAAGRGTPRAYSIVGNQLLLGPVPDAAYSLQAKYRASFPPLTAAAPTNDLLAQWPDLYLWGTLAEAADIVHDDASQQKYLSRFAAALDLINVSATKAAGSMTIKSDGRGY